MDKITEFFQELLRNRIHTKEGERVRVISTYLPKAKTPSITIFNEGGNLIPGSEKLINLKAPLNEKNPLYNPENPNKEYYQQFRRGKYNTNIQVNVWATEEDERYNINEQIKEIIWKLKSDNYNLCPNLENKQCIKISKECMVFNTNNYHTAKEQCPNPEKYGYYSLFTKYNIIRGSFRNNPEYNLDEPNHKQALLRTIHPFTLEYYEYYKLGGNIIFDARKHEIGEN